MNYYIEVRWSKGAYQWYYRCHLCPRLEIVGGHAAWFTAMEAAYAHIAKSHKGSRLGSTITGSGTRWELTI